MQKIADNNWNHITYHLRSKVSHKQRVDNCDWGWTVCIVGLIVIAVDRGMLLVVVLCKRE